MSSPIENQKDKVRLIDTCPKCHKPITSKSRAGSFTSFLFSENRCKCKSAEAAVLNSDDSTNQEDVRNAALIEMPDLEEKYEVIEMIGHGGMGAVWKVRDRSIETMLAVKVLRPELTADKVAVKRFEQEVRAAALLSHANLGAVYGSGITNSGKPYILMDFLEGVSLADVLKMEGKLDPARALDVSIQICEALIHAHDKGVLHRDVKPSNVILKSSEGGIADSVKLVDFGIAKVMPSVNSQSDRLTQTGDLFGSPLYMSPEQCLGEKLDSRTDVYSLGCVLYELLCGKSPFEANNSVRIVLNHLMYEPPTLNVDGPASAELKAIVAVALARNPDFRYTEACDMLADLKSVSNGGVASVARGILADPSKHSDKRTNYKNIGLKRPTLGLFVSAAAAVCAFLGLTNSLALVIGTILTCAAYFMWSNYFHKFIARARMIESPFQSDSRSGSHFSRSSKLTCLCLLLAMTPAIVTVLPSTSNPLMILVIVGSLVSVLAGLLLLVDLGFPSRNQTQISPRKGLALSIISPLSHVFMSIWLTMMAVFTAGYFSLLVAFIKNIAALFQLNEPIWERTAGLIVSAYAGLVGLAIVATFAVIVGLIITCNVRILMTAVRFLLPHQKISQKVNLLCLAVCAGFLAAPVACLAIPLNFGSGLCITALSILNAQFFLMQLLNVVDSQMEEKPLMLENER